MSDISIRFDGLLLGALLVLVTLVYSLLAVGFWLGALQSTTARGRRARIARAATFFAVASMIGVILTTAYMDKATPPTGPDWIDWLVLPALVLFALGCWRLYRLGRS
jgi:hypothetical protein